MLATSLGDGDANSAILRCSALRPASQDVMAQSEMLRHLKLPDTISILIEIALSIPGCMKQFRMRAGPARILNCFAHPELLHASLVASSIPRCTKQFKMHEAIQDARAS